MRRILRLAVFALLAGVHLSVAQTRDCLIIPPNLVDEEPVRIRLSPDGVKAAGDRLAFVHIWRDDDPERARHVRPLDPPERTTTFTFTRGKRRGSTEPNEGRYFARLATAPRAAWLWPNHDQMGEPAPGCTDQELRVTTGETSPFSGIRSEQWFGLHVPTTPELGSSVFFGRFGVRASVDFKLLRRQDQHNRLNYGLDAGWRGARGYVGGGVRYFPKSAPDLFRWRPMFVGAEELPPFKHHAAWLMVEVNVNQKPTREFWRTLHLSLGVRLDFAAHSPIRDK